MKKNILNRNIISEGKNEIRALKFIRIFKALLIFFAVAMELSSFAFAAINPKIQLQNYTLSEFPAQPGHIATLTLFLKETEWDYCADRVSVQLSMSYPLSIAGPDTQYVDRLCNNDSGKGIISFLIPVDPLAQSGTYQISMVTRYEKRFDKLSESNTLNIRVGGSPSFVASVLSSDPIDIYPGDSASVTFAFQNNGSTTVKSARAMLSTSDGVETKWASQTQELGTIQPRGSASAKFYIEAGKDTKPGSYKMSLVLDYVSEDDKNSTASFSFGLPIKPKAEFEVTSSARLTSDESKEAVLLVKNTGYEEAKNIKVRIKPIFPFSTDGTVRLIDSLKPGETKDLLYVVHVDKDATVGSQLLTLLFDFEGPTGKKFSDSADFSFTVVQKTLEEQLMGYWYVLALVAFIAIMSIMRRLRRNKSQKN